VKIEADKFYVTRDGRRVGPMAPLIETAVELSDPAWKWQPKLSATVRGWTYTDEGWATLDGKPDPADVVSEWKEPTE
jgi:hypothetical protein